MSKSTASTVARFESKTQPAANAEGCTRWTGTKNNRGYGTFWNGEKAVLAHRWAYQKRHGVVLAVDELVLHSCDNRFCVNVEHLRVGTAKENTKDMYDRGRARFDPPKGENQYLAKLTDAAVRDIRKRREDKSETVASLARRYGVAGCTVGDVLAGRTWKHVS